MSAPITVIEFGDFECLYCGLAEPVVRELHLLRPDPKSKVSVARRVSLTSGGVLPPLT